MNRPRPGRRSNSSRALLIVSVGCPAGIGPEVSVAAAAQLSGIGCVLVGDPATLAQAAKVVEWTPRGSSRSTISRRPQGKSRFMTPVRR